MSPENPVVRQHYRLTYTGQIAQGVTREQVLAGLSRLFNRPQSELLPLMSGELRVLKVAPTVEALEPFRTAMAQAGAIAQIQDTMHTGAQDGVLPHIDGAASCPLRVLPQPTRQQSGEHQVFVREGEHFLSVDLAGEVWIKTKSMVAYTGDIEFTIQDTPHNKLKSLMKRTLAGVEAGLTKVSGIGTLHLADRGKKVTVLRLDGESLVVNSNNVLAFESGIEWRFAVLRRVPATVVGGLLNVRLHGVGLVAITTHREPLTLPVRHPYPVHADAEATVAWSASLAPRFESSVSVKTLIRRARGEPMRLRFEGEGFVVVQPQ